MFHRLMLEEWTAVFTLIAFVTALSVYVTIFYRALRMRPGQIEHLSSLPFADETAASSHE
jgi:hypothetical protein